MIIIEVDAIKSYLYNNQELIISLLEHLGCHSIKEHHNRISSALPDGDNAGSVNIYTDNEGLKTIIYTRGISGDIITLVKFIKGIKFRDALEYIAKIANIPIGYTRCKDYDFLNKFCKRYRSVPINYSLPPTYGLRFINALSPIYYADGVSYEVQAEFGVCYDIHDSRIVVPIRDTEGNIITYKGRTTNIHYKEMDIPKFLSYEPYHASEILFGYYESYFNIISKGEIIIVESEKAVMQAKTIGVDNVIALAKNKMSATQIRLVQELNVDVVFALDNDVPIEGIKLMAEEFRGLCRTYYVGGGELVGKESPFDRGEDIWYNLYINKIEL